MRQGPVAQGLEQSAHNRLVVGSIPTGPIKKKKMNIPNLFKKSTALFTQAKSRSLLIIGLVILAYMVVVIGKISWGNWQVNQQIQGLRKELGTLKSENSQLESMVWYLKTDAYKERQAREKLGLVKPGEKVVNIIPSKKPKIDVEALPEEKPRSNWQKWLDFFFANDASA